MNVTFHALSAIALTHLTGGAGARGPADTGAAPGTRPLVRLATAGGLGVLAHGVLDGLRHQYPLRSELDVVLALLLVGVWLTLLRPSARPLLLAAFTGAVLPDVVDLGPALAEGYLGLRVPRLPSHVFPWHWREGSGSLFRGEVPAVSLTNHCIVVGLSLAAVVGFPQVLRVRRRG